MMLITFIVKQKVIDMHSKSVGVSYVMSIIPQKSNLLLYLLLDVVDNHYISFHNIESFNVG